MNLRFCLTVIACLFALTENVEASDLKAPLPLSRISTVSAEGRETICALFRGRTKWRPAKRVRGRGSVYKAIRGTRAQRAACESIGNLGTIVLSQLPSTEDIFRANESASGLSAFAVSGTPPALVDIPAGSIKDIFWRSGVIDGINSGSPTPEQCAELFDSPADGTSGGFNACYLTMNAGEAFQTVLRAGTTLCYMKRALSQEGLDTGAVQLVSGAFPGGSVDNLVSPPSGTSARIVKINAAAGGGTTSIYLRIYGAATNSAEGNSYRFDFWSCDAGPSGAPSEIERTSVSTAGVYSSSSQGNSGSVFANTVRAFLVRSGDALTFDVSRARSATTAFDDGSQMGKSELEIDGSNIVRVKRYADFGTDSNKAYSVSRMTGSSLTELRFLDGAFNEIFSNDSFGSFSHSGGIEYRTSVYTSAPGNSFVSDLGAVNLSTDTFYSTLTPLTFDSTGFSCSEPADITMSIDLAAPAFTPIRAACEGTRLDGMDYCRDSEVQTAVTNYFARCTI